MIPDLPTTQKPMYARSDSGPGYTHKQAQKFEPLKSHRPEVLGSSTSNIPKSLSWQPREDAKRSLPTSPEEQKEIIQSLQQPMKSHYASQVNRPGMQPSLEHKLTQEPPQPKREAPPPPTEPSAYQNIPHTTSTVSTMSTTIPRAGPYKRPAPLPPIGESPYKLDSKTDEQPREPFDPLKDVLHPMREPGVAYENVKEAPKWGTTEKRLSSQSSEDRHIAQVPVEVHAVPYDQPQYATSTERLIDESKGLKGAYI